MCVRCSLQDVTNKQTNTIKLWSIDTKLEIATLIGHNNDVNSVAFSPDGKYFASGSGYNKIKLWSVDSKQEITTLRGLSNKILSIAFSLDGTNFAFIYTSIIF